MNEHAFARIQSQPFGRMRSLFIQYTVGTGPFVKMKTRITTKFVIRE